MSYGRIERGEMAADRFTQISNSLFRDPRLSAKAKGIFGFISTHRQGWGVTPASIAASMRDGEGAVKAGLRELEAFGYLLRRQPRREDGTMGSIVYRITDMPSSQPLSEIGSPGVTCEDVPRDGSLEGPRRSEPVDENPLAVHPPADDAPHKKTNSNDIKGEKTTTPSAPPLALVPQPAGEALTGGGGGEVAPLKGTDKDAAAAFVDRLPFGGRVPGPRQRDHLVAQIAVAFAAGWSELDLRAQLTEETQSAKSLTAVYRHRLDPDNLPPAPVRKQREEAYEAPYRPQKAKCSECHRPLRNSTEDALCLDCREDATA
ncbi:hypothetical protein [Streptomyces sp. NEAU-H3]|uniref:hypothetical protein n=1 Tax=Streptomyces sp. NEAU-H3 TaxID=2720636 RepID=UPI0014392BCF|nr:hypothetical protein [Streptomyces sp. NEAU-H3]NJA56672.1 hypothetical protein [Streptomyces sp. NEAU-H3]